MLDTAGAYAGAVTQNLMQVLLITSFFACVLSFHNIVARYRFALARIGSLPAVLATVHPATGARRCPRSCSPPPRPSSP